MLILLIVLGIFIIKTYKSCFYLTKEGTFLIVIMNLCNLSSTEGKCIRSESGELKRSGAGKHTSADGSIYTGEWHEDKVCAFS